MSNSNQSYEPPKVWQWNPDSGGKFANINRPTSGATVEKDLPRGEHSLQLYSLATPNGVKTTILLEELIETGERSAEYDAWPINILEGDQFSSGFVSINPNSKIPALVDYSIDDGLSIFESGAILLYLAEKFNLFLPTDISQRSNCMSWLFWQMGSAPFLGGGFGHFYAYAPEKYEYPINRYTLEVKRQLDVLDKQLAKTEFIAGDQYTIADMAIWPWYGALVLNKVYEAAEFLQVNDYKNLVRWTEQIASRPAVKRGQLVNKTWGNEEEQLPERHSPNDFKSKKL
ncbi:MAG: glutathione-dependent disulfide-bond oxidoreductase [Gammaproteobacteria bacterium]|nr:glutathione-dependent disulfide-bond oxidoreductase [Gammaproteobacteria bacterium]